jgi:peptidoglycan/xylan/chitin deacetylase (PgdA/CDA1 family)
MANFRLLSNYTKSLFIVSLAFILAAIGGQLGWMVVLICLYMLVLGIGSYRIQSNFFLQSVNQANTDKKSIVLSFDDGPSPAITPAILDILKEFECQAIFFCIGHKISGNETILQRMVAEGHLVANHSFSHSPWFDLYSPSRMLEEIQATNEEIYRATGIRNKLFRPPYGVTNPMLAKAIQRSGLTSIGWSKRSLDTVIKDKRKVLARISRNMQPGDIILLHDSISRCPAVLKEFLAFLPQTGYKVERLDKVNELKCYEK